MKKIKTRYFGSLLFCCSLLVGCTSTHSVSVREAAGARSQLGLERLNQILAGKQVTVVMRDGKSFSAAGLRMRSDSAFFADAFDSSIRSTPTGSIDRVEEQIHSLGAFQGILLGALGGMVLCGGTAYLTTDNHAPDNFGPAWAAGGGAILGGLCGEIYGAIHGYTDAYELEQ